MRDGGAAFPVLDAPMDPTRTGLVLREPGMTLLDWFAGQALAGLLACSDPVAQLSNEEYPAANARHAYDYAVAMLAERARREGGDRE